MKYQNTRYENRDRNTISLRNSIDKKIQSIKEERKRTIEKRKSI